MLLGKGYEDRFLTEAEIRDLMSSALARAGLDGKRVLIIIPDGTRTAPMPLMVRLFYECLGEQVAALDYLIALGTHKLMSEEAINQLIGVTPEERARAFPKVNVFNHRWDLPDTFVTLGEIPAAEIEEITGGLMSQSVKVRLNRMIFDYDQIIICGPTFPHEVVGFSGGNKYFFPGIGGETVINFSHWLGAVITSYEVIGQKYTPVRRVIDRAASFIDRPKLCFSMVVKEAGSRGAEEQGGRGAEEILSPPLPGSPASVPPAPCALAGLFIGTPEEAYDAAADLSAKVHITWVEKPFQRVLSVMPRQYEDIWTAAKGMYKLEPAIADGGEVIIYAPHIGEISYSHGKLIEEIGYHVRDYFLKQWDKFKHYPGGVLAHSTHLRGIGTYDAETGIESPRINVTLATRIPEERCRKVNLGYMDPERIVLDEWRGREAESILLVPKAGELLYRLRIASAKQASPGIGLRIR